MTEEERKAWIDAATYEDLLRVWRFDPTPSPWFDGEIGKHFSRVIEEKRQALSHEDRVAASKRVGWDQRELSVGR